MAKIHYLRQKSIPKFSTLCLAIASRQSTLKRAWHTVFAAVEDVIFQAIPRANIFAVAQEFGTYSAKRVLHALRQENRWHHYGSAVLGHPTKRVLKETFCPDDETWRDRVLKRGKELLRQGLAKL